uniref:Uncharacterized protein n=1 Tax=Clytia hemisphaerica TaxID=252671 RepID=A0A7M5UXF8_9CNID
MKCLVIFALVCVAFVAADLYDEEGSGEQSCLQEFKECRDSAEGWRDKFECSQHFYKCRKGEVKDCKKECNEDFHGCRKEGDTNVAKCVWENFKCRVNCSS